MTNEYLKDVEIDADNLDMAWVDQPRLRMQYGELLAKANHTRDVAKRTLEVTKAALDSEARASISKVTEGAVKAYIATHHECVKLTEDYEQKKYEADLLQAAVIAIDTKKTSLENLVKLGLGGYFSMPVVPKEFPRAGVEIEKRVASGRERKQRAGLNKKKGK